jgi:hypothetical protein
MKADLDNHTSGKAARACERRWDFPTEVNGAKRVDEEMSVFYREVSKI